MKKLITLITVFILLLIIFVIFLITPKNYVTKYTINNIEVREEYNKKDNYYYFQFAYQDKVLEYLINHKYINHRKLINKIIIINEDELEIELESDYLDNVKLCYKKACETTLNTKIVDTYQNINIYNKDEKIYIWNYKGFIDVKNKKTITILNNEIYIPSLLTKINKYLMIPNYDDNYYFNKIYYLNTEDNKLKDFKIKYDIAFDSYILGVNDKSIYLMDKKNLKEYEIVVHKKKIRINNNKLLVNDEWQKVNNESIVNHEKVFSYSNLYNYELTDNNLYLHYLDSDNKILINKDVTYIVDKIDNTIYYLIDDTLYKYNVEDGIIKILEYNNLHFNYKNLIYIFD